MKGMLDETELINLCIRHDRHAQKILFEFYYGKMLMVCLRYIKNREDACDVLNNAFLKVFRKIGQFRSEGSLEGWIKKIVINSSLDFNRAAKRYTSIIKLVDDYHLHSDISDQEELSAEFISGFSAEELLMFVNELSPVPQSVFNLFVIDGYTHKEIGAQLGISEGTSKRYLFDARKKLQQMIKQSKSIQQS